MKPTFGAENPCHDPAEAVAYLAAHGKTATEDEVAERGDELKALAEKVKAAMDENGGELSGEQLTQVADGSFLAALITSLIIAGVMGGAYGLSRMGWR